MTNVTHKFLSMYLFLILTLYMFRAHRANHQERQIVSIQPLVAVTLCRWPCHVQHRAHHPERQIASIQRLVTVTPCWWPLPVTRDCIDTICPP
jgi:hypothetical protein